MAQVIKEIPSGAINGVNKIFTLLNTPKYIDDIFFDGAIYTTYSLSGNILTLVDAPITSLFVDYEAETDTIVVDSTITFGNIKNKVWNLLGQKSTSTSFSDTIVGDEINYVARQVLKGRVKSMLDPNRIYRAGNLWFTEGRLNVRVKSGSTLSAILNVGDVVAECDTQFLLSSGYVDIGGDIIKYTGVSATEIQGITGQTTSHLIGESVYQLYEMPLAIDKPKTVYKVVANRKIEIPLANENSQAVYYDIIRHDTKTLLRIVGLEENDLIEINYHSKFTDMGLNTDINPLPESYGISVLAYLVAGGLAFEKGLPVADRILSRGYASLQNMYQDYTNEIQVIKQSIKPKSYKFNSLRR